MRAVCVIVRCLMYLVLLWMFLHTGLTGSPVPLRSIQNLNHPVPVRGVTADGVVLGDGRRLTLPHIRRIPFEARLMRAAVREGVEVDADGEVYGLLWMDRYCGNDPVSWRRLRVNLSDLAGAIDVRSLPDELTGDESMPLLEDMQIPSRDAERDSLNMVSRIRMQQIRRQLEFRRGQE